MQINNNQEHKSMHFKDRIILLGIILFLIMLFARIFIWLFSILSDIFNDTLTAWIIIWVIILIILFFIIKRIIKSIRLDKAIKSGVIRRKRVKVIGFKWIKHDNGHIEDYYVIFSDWENIYQSIRHVLPRIIWKTDEDLKNDEFYKKKWIILDLNNRDITKHQLEQRISDLELLKIEGDRINNSRSDSEILEYKNKIKDLEPYHLHTNEWDFYIWDEDVVLIDPEDSSNYILESENKKFN